MKRRDFLKVVGVTAAGVLIPYKAITYAKNQHVLKPTENITIARFSTDQEYLYYEVPFRKEVKKHVASYYPTERLMVEANKKITILGLDIRLPEPLVTVLELKGTEREWVYIPTTGVYHLDPGDTVTVEFGNNTMLTVS